MARESDYPRASWEEAIRELERLAEESYLTGDTTHQERLQDEARLLQLWLDEGQQGPPPVDLASHQIALHRPPAESLDTIVMATPPAAGREPGPSSDHAGPAPVGAQPTLAPGDNGHPVDVSPAEAIGPAVAPPLEPETPEHVALRHQVGEVRGHYERGELRQAVALADSLLGRVDDDDQLRRQIEDLRERADGELKGRLQEAWDRAEAARLAGKTAEARRYYEEVVELDPGHDEARRAILDLDAAITADLSKSELGILRGGLKERRDLQRLGEAVYKAEAMDGENLLTDELAGLLREARQEYDRLRREHGEETTMMRFGALEARKTARDKVADRVRVGERTIFDETTNSYRPSHQVLEEANKLLEDSSEDTAQYELGRANQALPANPRWAKLRLENALGKPFQERHLRTLQGKQHEIEELIQKQDAAEALLTQAEGETDPVRVYERVAGAYSIFPHLLGLPERLAQARQTATEDLAVEMREHYNRAEVFLQTGQFDEARSALNKLAAVPTVWPEVERPQELLDLLAQAATLRQRINTQANLVRDFDALAATIRKQVLDPNQRAAGFNLFKTITDSKRFENLPGLLTLEAEMDQYKGVEEQLAEARAACDDGRWTRVRDLTRAMLQSGKAGQLKDQIEALLTEANLELAISVAQQALKDDDVGKAENELERYLPNTQLESRLTEELQIIRQAKADLPTLLPFYNHALNLAQSSDEKERLQALRLFRFLGGDTTEPRQEDWPEYKLSLYTAAARSQARELCQSLRQQLLTPILEAYQNRQLERAKSDSKIDWRLLAEHATALRETRLLDNETERAAVRWLELDQRSQEAQAREKLADWDGAVAIWRELDAHYPRAVETELRLARVQQVLGQADQHLRNKQPDKALDVLREAENEPGLGQNLDIILKLAEVHTARGEFEPAESNLQRAERLPGGESRAREKRAQLEHERVIIETLGRAEKARQTIGDREALRVVRDALTEEGTKGSPRLLAFRSQLFDKIQANLLPTALKLRATGTDEDKIAAVVALVDLRDLEELAELPKTQRRAEAELQPLRAELAKVAKDVITRARQFDPRQLSLDQALREADTLNGRLQTFSKVTPLFEEELGGIGKDLNSQRSEISNTYDRLKKLQGTIQAARNNDDWRDALSTGNFEILDQHLRQIHELRLELLEVRQLDTRLAEWKEIYRHLTQTVELVRRQFVYEEDFEAAQHTLRLLVSRPETRPETRQAWQQLHQPDYEQVRQAMNARMRVEDVFGEAGAFVGWAAVEQAARQRHEEWRAWQAWDRECLRLMNEADLARATAEAQAAEAPLVERQRAWKALEASAELAIKRLIAGPVRDDQKTPVTSIKARDLERLGQTRLEHAEYWLHQAQIQLRLIEGNLTESGFPTAREFADAATQRNVPLLRRLVERADRVGPSNHEERQRLEQYRKVLTKLQKENNPNRQGLLRKLFNLD